MVTFYILLHFDENSAKYDYLKIQLKTKNNFLDPEAVGVDPPAPVDRQPRPAADMAGTSTQNSEAANQAANNNSSNVTSKVPRVAKTFRAYLPSACHRTYSCVHCRAHLANHDELISKSFQGSQGRAYLFNSVVNIGCGPAEERVLLTGKLHSFSCQKSQT